MIVITTPTGDVGSQVLARFLDAGTEPVRVIVRDPSRLHDAILDRVQVIVGSHSDPAVLNQALAGAQSLFWLVPPSMRANSAEGHYLTFTRPAVEAIRRHHIPPGCSPQHTPRIPSWRAVALPTDRSEWGSTWRICSGRVPR
jgi:uncharacterized protein YbjT (DUF2867 family)